MAGSGAHCERVVQGINLISLLWTQGAERLPCDFRIYNRAEDGLTKNDHFQARLQRAHERGFQPEMVVFDRWYAALANWKYVRHLGWHWFTRLKANRLVSVPGNRKNRPASEGLKQFTGIERGQFRVAIAQQNHIALAIRAFLRLEIARLQRGISWFEAKHSIIRQAIRHYLAHPSLILQPTA